MKQNYEAWDVDIADFNKLGSDKERLRFFLKFAVLAPSSHNTQPWAFSVEEHSIKVYRETSRRLPVADVNDRQLFLSIGCAIENIVAAADYFGYTTHVEYESQNSEDSHVAATIKFNKGTMPKIDDKNHIIHSISQRKTNRNKYKKDKPDEKILNELKKIENKDVQIFFVHEQKKLDELADIAVLASIESMVDDEFRKELSHHVKHNLTNSKIGMPGFTLGMPTALSFLAPHLLKRFNMEKASQKQNEKLLKEHTPYIVVIATRGDQKADWLEAGQVFERLALIATKYSIGLSPWGAPIQIGEFYKNIQKVIQTDKRPQMFFRMGYPIKEARFSPRLSADETLK